MFIYNKPTRAWDPKGRARADNSQLCWVQRVLGYLVWTLIAPRKGLDWCPRPIMGLHITNKHMTNKCSHVNISGLTYIQHN